MSAQPVSFRFMPERVGDHIEVTVRCGPEGSRALAGKLTMRPGEWSLLRWLLATTPPLETNEAYIPHWARGQATVMCHTPIDMTPVVVDNDPLRPLLDRFDAVRASYPIEKDQTDDLVETSESRQQERCPEEPAPLTSGPAPQPKTGTDSTSQARSATTGEGGAPGAAPSHHPATGRHP